MLKAIAQSFYSTPEEGTQNKIGRYLAMVNYHANPITSGMFITATAPNPLVVDLVNKATGGDIQLSWTTWAVAMFVLGMLCLIIMPWVIYAIYPPEVKVTPDAKAFATDNLDKMGRISPQEKIMLGVFALMLLLWANVPAFIFGEQFEVDATTTAFIGLTTLILTGVLTWDDVLKEKSAWDTIIWFGALIMMASYLNKLGLISWFSDSIESMIGVTGVGWIGAGLIWWKLLGYY